MVDAAAQLSARPLCAAWCAMLACVAPLAHGQDAATSLVVTGQCREGVAQGGYALRAPDGRLRVQGAFTQGQRVGSFIFWSSTGVRIAHLPFDADALNGTVSLWYIDAPAGDDAPRKLEAGYRAGERHGLTRSWYPDGRRRAEFEYAGGALVSAYAWSPAGTAYDETEARALAERDRASDVEYLDALLATVRRHMPDCAPPPARLHV
jgi:hypothetical protein